MEVIYFNLEENQEYITLVNLLKYENIISSGGEINFLIDNESIFYNNQVETRKRKKCFSGDEIIINNEIKIIIT